MNIPDISSITTMIGPILSSLIHSISDMAMQLGTAVFPSNPTLALLAIAGVSAFLLKDKLNGGVMFIALAVLLYIILSGNVTI